MQGSRTDLIHAAYAGFNRRDIDSVLALMTPDVDWPNGMEGGREVGYERIRAYWTRQWGIVDPRVDPVGVDEDGDGRAVVQVHQVVRDLSGKIIMDKLVRHIYSFREGLICRMDIEEGEAGHSAEIERQFSLQAAAFARAPELHTEAVIQLLVEAADPRETDEALDVACGPGSVVVAFAARVRLAVGLDATSAMLDQARALAKERGAANVEWRLGDVYSLPFPDESFDIVTCRFAFHHFEQPDRAFREMVRVCRRGGRVVVCDAIVAADPEKAAAFHAMERHRDPSTVEFRSESFLAGLFTNAGLAPPAMERFQVSYDVERLMARSFPLNDDRDTLRRMIEHLIEMDAMEAGGQSDLCRVTYPSVVLCGIRLPTKS